MFFEVIEIVMMLVDICWYLLLVFVTMFVDPVFPVCFMIYKWTVLEKIGVNLPPRLHRRNEGPGKCNGSFNIVCSLGQRLMSRRRMLKSRMHIW
jgi:hypothetical protein